MLGFMYLVKLQMKANKKIYLLVINDHNLTQFIVKFRHRPIDHRPGRIRFGIHLELGWKLFCGK